MSEGGKQNLYSYDYSKKKNSEYGYGITACTDDKSDDAWILFDKRPMRMEAAMYPFKL